LLVYFLVPFDIEMARDPTNGDVDGAKLLLGLCDFVVEDVEEIVTGCGFDGLGGYD
jgi:hypothetical protein